MAVLAGVIKNKDMRKIIVLEHISLDGVIQAPGGPGEDPTDGSPYGGWIMPFSDGVLGNILKRLMSMPFDLLLGRRTFEIWAPYWPQHADDWPGVNTATKYIASNTMNAHEWQPSVFLNGEIAEKVSQLKQTPGPDIQVWGSGNLLQTLFKQDLIDSLWLMIYPITLGVGKKLFSNGTTPLVLNVKESQVTPKGVIVVNYERSSPIKSN